MSIKRYAMSWGTDEFFLHSFPMSTQSAGEHFGAWEAFAWDADDSKGYVTNDDYPSKDVSESYPVSRTPLSSCPV